MTPDRTRDALFAAGALLATLIVLGVLFGLRPVDEARDLFGYGWGWGLILAIVAPSYVFLSRALRREDARRFTSLMVGGSAVRLLAMLACVLGFLFLVETPPMISFLLAFGLGYVLLTALELRLLLRRAPDGRPA